MTFDFHSYLSRVGLADVLPDLEGLDALQRAQIGAIPFEALDAYLGALPDLAPATLWQRMVAGKRGGWCFELNLLFGQALAAAGFKASPVLARVHMGAPEGGPRSHLGHIVRLGGRRYWADVGFGGPAPLSPLLLDSAAEQQGYRFREVHGGEHLLEMATPEGWFALLSFDEARASMADIEAANLLCTVLPGAPFPQHLMVNLGGGDDKASLFNDRLTLVQGARRQERLLRDATDLSDTLARHFGIEPGADNVVALWHRLAASRAAA